MIDLLESTQIAVDVWFNNGWTPDQHDRITTEKIAIRRIGYLVEVLGWHAVIFRWLFESLFLENESY